MRDLQTLQISFPKASLVLIKLVIWSFSRERLLLPLRKQHLGKAVFATLTLFFSLLFAVYFPFCWFPPINETDWQKILSSALPTEWAMKPLRWMQVNLLCSCVACSHLNGFIDQLVQHFTGIPQVMGSNPGKVTWIVSVHMRQLLKFSSKCENHFFNTS